VTGSTVSSHLLVTDPEAVLPTNPSWLPVVDLAVATSRPAQVVGLHFFNPVPVQKLVEVVPALTTATDTVTRARSYGARSP
jgi:3-hydroxybutyryl-CoA dehydrogenase